MHSILIVTGIIVIGVILCFVYLPRIMTPRRLDSLFHFVLTLLATLAGVFLAFQISSYQSIQDDKDFLVGLLDESAYEHEFEIKSLEEDYLSLIEDKQDNKELEQLVKTHPLSTIISLEIIINSTLLPKFGSPSYTEIYTAKHELANIRMSINSRDIDPSAKPALINSYVRWLSYMQELLLTESSYVRDDKSADEVSEHYRNLKSEFSLQ